MVDFTSKQVDVGGATLRVLEVGSGRPVIFCHGFPAVASSWRSQMEAVAGVGWRAIAPDMRGYGGSSAPHDASAYTPFDTVGDLVGLLKGLDLHSAVLVGHDFGANIAWNAAVMRPDLFTAVFGISVTYRPAGGPSFLEGLRKAGVHDFYMFRQMRPEADDEWADARQTIPGNYYWTSGQPADGTGWDPFDPSRGLLRPLPEPLTVIDADYLEEAISTFERTGFHAPLNYYRSIDRFSDLSRAFAGAVIRQPTFFLTGAADGLNKFTQPSEEGLREVLSDLRGFVSIEGVGHWPQFEAPDEVNDELKRFLATLV